MKKIFVSYSARKIFWWFGCFLSVLLSLQVVLISLLFIRLSVAPLDISGLGQHFIGTFYIAEDGNLTPKKKNAVGKEAWERLELQWIIPDFSDWLSNRNIGDLALSLSGLKLFDRQGAEVDHLNHVQARISITPFAQGKVGIKNLSLEGLDLHLKKLDSGEVILDFPGVHKGKKPAKSIDLSFINRHVFAALQAQNIHCVLSPDNSLPSAIFDIPNLNFINFSKDNEISKWQGDFRFLAKAGGQTASISGVKKEGPAEEKSAWTIQANIPSPSDFSNILPVMEKIHLPIQSEIIADPVSCALALKTCRIGFSVNIGNGFYIQPDGSKMRVKNAAGTGNVRWRKDYKNFEANVSGLDIDWIDSFGQKTPEHMRASLALDDLLKPKDTSLFIGGHFDALNIAALPSLWPEGLAKGARKWIVENLTAGRAKNFTLNVGLKSQTGFDHLRVNEMSGDLTAKDVTVRWLETMPVFKHVDVKAKFLDADNILVEMENGAIYNGKKEEIKLSKGSVRMTGVTSHKQFAGIIRLGLSGSVPRLVDILSRDRLPILKRFRKYYSRPEGAFSGKIMLSFPFTEKLKADDIIFDTEVKTSNLGARLREIGQVRAFNGVLKAKNKALTIKAKAQVRDVPVTMDLYDDLTANTSGQDMLNIHLESAVTRRNLEKLGMDFLSEKISGEGRLKADILQPWEDKDHNRTDMVLNLDLHHAAVDGLLWKKAENVPAGASLHAGWQDGNLSYVTDIKAYGPEIAVQASTLIKNYQIEGVDISHLQIGKNEGKLRFEWPLILENTLSKEENAQKSKRVQHYRLTLDASKIDLEPFLETTSNEVQETLKGGKKSTKPIMKKKNGRTILPEGNWDVDLKIAKAFLGKGRILGPLNMLLSWDEGHLKKADIHIEKPYPAIFNVSQNTKNKQEHFLRAETDHLGEWLSWAKIYDHLKGGQIKMEGKFAPSIMLATLSDPLVIHVAQNGKKSHRHRKKEEKKEEEILKQLRDDELAARIEQKMDAEHVQLTGRLPVVHTEGFGLGLPPYSGKISVKGLQWRSSLTSILLAKIFSPTNWTAVNGNLEDISINGAVSVQDGVIGFGNLQGKSDILSATMEGTINILKEKIDLGGTVSPDYYWNSSPGHLPSFLGYIFSPEKGSGILAMGYTLDGLLSQPHFNLNPYMMLLPGILRKIANPSL